MFHFFQNLMEDKTITLNGVSLFSLLSAKSKEASTALGGCASCIKLIVNENPEIRQLAIEALYLITTDNSTILESQEFLIETFQAH
jgi:hypothetical protein